VFEEYDRDMIVMQHKFEYELDNKYFEITSSLVHEGKDYTNTAMSSTVGLPVGIAVKMILTGKIKAKGIQVPVSKAIYEPVLEELKKYDVNFIETEEEIPFPVIT
jgi:saccharopine dehydrogenase (NADP+, L-glutamate forming)